MRPVDFVLDCNGLLPDSDSPRVACHPLNHKGLAKIYSVIVQARVWTHNRVA